MGFAYSEALEALNKMVNYEWQQPAAYTPEVVSLERPRRLLAAMGDPQETYPTIHIAGTKGKGSVSAMCASILQAAGYRVGFYSSPHLQEFRERFRINDTMIAPETFAAIMDTIAPLIDPISGLTYWEVLTAIGFEFFRREKVDIAVIEVGLGGRLDATNVLKHPRVTTITSLSYDHMHLLGNTLTLIAGEKAAIMKPGAPAVSAPQNPEAMVVLEKFAAERGVQLTVIGNDWVCEPGASRIDGQPFSAGPRGEPPRHYVTPLIGSHQAINGAVALATIDKLRGTGFAVPRQAEEKGLAVVNWPGRFEVVGQAPYVILDSAHNADSADRVGALVQAVLPGKPLTLIFGAFADKDVGGIFRALLPLTQTLIVMRARSPRAFEAETLVEKAIESGYNRPLITAANAVHAYKLAHDLTPPDGVILATGSTTIVGELRDILGLPAMQAAYLTNGATRASTGELEGKTSR